MGKYAVNKILQSLLVVFLVSIIIFAIVEILPGDVSAMLIPEDATDLEVMEIRERLGLNKSAAERYVEWLLGALRGDMGVSAVTGEPVAEKVFHALCVTLRFTIPALLIGTAIGIVFGVLAAINRGKAIDSVISVIANVGNAAPGFWFAILLILVFSVKLKWLPVQGYTALSDNLEMGLKQMILPCLVLMLPTIAAITRQTRSSVLEILNHEYVRTARSKGQKEQIVIFKHVLKNALIPILTMLGLRLNNCFAGAMISESIFGIPGMGSVLKTAILNQDQDVMLGGTVMMAVAVVAITFFIDIMYGFVDPRMRNSR